MWTSDVKSLDSSFSTKETKLGKSVGFVLRVKQETSLMYLLPGGVY